jgi:tRNA pseudouridine55 synthase
MLWQRDDRAAFELEVSSGTYVRQLVAGLGDAYCDELRRTAIGEFRVDDADPEREVPLGEALAFLPHEELPEERVRPTLSGLSTQSSIEGEAIRLTHEGDLLAIARGDGTDLKPYVVFPR